MVFHNLTEEEKTAVHKLTNYALAKAAFSLEQILRTLMEANPVKFGVKTFKGVPMYSLKKGNKVHVIKTEIIGDIKGMCYLIMSEEEVTKIHNRCLPSSILSNNSPKGRLMKLELLTEIDNIIAGSVITQFANYLKLNIHRHVPSMHHIKGEEINKYIKTESTNMKSTVQFKSSLYTDELDISPEFIWLLQKDFIEKSRKLAKQDQAFELN